MFTVPEDTELEKTSKITVVEFFAKQVAQSMTRLEYVSYPINYSLKAGTYFVSNFLGAF